jgi:hypothetical protein
MSLGRTVIRTNVVESKSLKKSLNSNIIRLNFVGSKVVRPESRQIKAHLHARFGSAFSQSHNLALKMHKSDKSELCIFLRSTVVTS